MNGGTTGNRVERSNPTLLENVVDGLEFERNKCSRRAKKIVVIDHNLVIELWFNSHYYERHYVGDENGRRIGIDPAMVESLVTR